jgi:hypothetical protein
VHFDNGADLRFCRGTWVPGTYRVTSEPNSQACLTNLRSSLT